jgi:predicted nucleotidyltransferase
MKTREDILKLLAREMPQLAKRYPIHTLALFGSYARGDHGATSDVDLVVDIEPSVGLEFVTLAEELEALLGLRVDLVSRRAITPRHWKVVEPELIYV